VSRGKGWTSEEHVLAGPFRTILERACAELTEVPFPLWQQRPTLALRSRASDTSTMLTTSRRLWSRRYAERYGCTERTADRHFSLVLSQPSIPVYIADRIAALVGVPMAYVEATA
jgi:hypothetical protein